VIHEWPGTVQEAVEIQQRLRGLVDARWPQPPPAVRTVAGLDVAYAAGSDLVAAAVAVLDARSLKVVETATAVGEARFPYVPGLFAFRELPTLVQALGGLETAPDVLVCDGQGLAHPRRFGLACHVGVFTGLPTIGVAKQPLGRYEMPGPRRGDSSQLSEGGEIVGRALRTQDSVKPVFVSVGHRIDLDTASGRVLAWTRKHRLPEPIRQADQLSRHTLTGALNSGTGHR
jgi:deoxyribonuclease V